MLSRICMTVLREVKKLRLDETGLVKMLIVKAAG